MPFSADTLGDRLQLVDHGRSVDVIAAIAEPPAFTRTIDGASTVEVTCSDARRTLLRSSEVATRSTLVALGLTFELAGLRKSGDRYTLIFEDQVVAKLRRQTKHLVVKGGHTTREAFTRRLAREADVGVAVDPSLGRAKVRSVLERSAAGQKTTSWDILGSDVAEPVHARRFSDGTQLVLGADSWLAGRFTPIRLAEHTDAVNNIDFDLDEGKRASSATVDVDADLWAAPPGSPIVLTDMGPADGAWLVSQFTRPLTSTRGTVTLTRARHQLPEPRPKAKKKGKGKGKEGDDGDD